MLRSLKQARYSAENKGHFALAASSYTHFTSPIRRYPDLIVHRLLDASFDGTRDLIAPERLELIAHDCSETERRAADAERELVEWKKARFMESRVGEEFRGLITSTTRFGFFVELENLFVEGLVPIDTLPGDRYMFQENTRKIVGQRTRREFSIGDTVSVLLERVDPVEHKLQFSLVERERVRKKKKSIARGRRGGAQRELLGGQRFEQLFVNSLLQHVVLTAVFFHHDGKFPGGPQQAELLFAGRQRGCFHAGHAARAGSQFAEKIAREDLVIQAFERCAGRDPAVFHGAEEVRTGGECQQKHNDVDEGRQHQSEDVASGGRGEKLLEGDEQIFLAGDGAVDEIAVSRHGRFGELAGVKRLLHVVPGNIVIDLPVSLQLLFGGIERLGV